MIVLHVGAGKCGSSALQRFLSNNPELETKDGKKIYYHLVNKRGVFGGEHIKNKVKKTISGYMSSQSAAILSKTDNSSAFKDLSNDDIHVFSAEVWIREAKTKDIELFVKQFNQPVVILMYVRPQVPLLNSAYWQWGAWADVPPRKWIMSYAKGYSKWYSKYKAFVELENVAECKVRILSGDIINDFLSLFSAVNKDIDNNMSNKSLPGEILRIMQRNRQLRPNEHDSKIDFFFEKNFSGIGGSTPWVIGEKLMNEIINESHSDNKKLLEVLDSEQAELMKNDERWWNIYSVSSEVESAAPVPVKDKVCEDLLVRAIELLMDKKVSH